MINRVLRATFSLSLRRPTDLTEASHAYEHLSALTQRVEIEILARHEIPELVKWIDELPHIKQMMSYNPYLINGGYQFEEFPLIKLLHIALKMLEDNLQDREHWVKFENIIKIRLHRCTIEQHMRLLYIMLKSWPFYRFKIDFITSICLALKKDLPIMNGPELRTLFRITATGSDQGQRFAGNVLVNLQSSILKRVIDKWQARSKDLKNRQLSIEGLYLWNSLAIPLALKNNLFDLILERKSIMLAQLLTSIYEKATANNLMVQSAGKQSLLLSLNLLSVFEPVHHLFLSKQKEKESKSWSDQFPKFKGSILSHGQSGIEKLLKGQVSAKLLRWVLTVVDCQVLQNMLQVPGQVQIQAGRQTRKYPRVINLIEKTIKGDPDAEDKIALVWQVMRHRLVEWQLARLYYSGIDVPSTKQGSLLTVWLLIQIQLTLYAYTSSFQPLQKNHQFIIQFLTNHPCNFRNFQWLAFHYLRLANNSDNHTEQTSLENRQLQTLLEGNESKYVKTLSKLLREVKASDSSKLIKEERQRFMSDSKIMTLKKFFIEVRLHEMETLEPIIPNFNRLPHFSNMSKRIAINAYSKSQISSPMVVVEKRLLNDVGWKVVNLPIPEFLDYTLSQKIQTIGRGIREEDLLLGNTARDLLD